jgi:LysR family glycine cleavage system transcriptional activator
MPRVSGHFSSFFLRRYKIFLYRLSMRISHLNALRALEATLRTGTFSRAADELGVTTAAVGQQIRGLEDYLGRKLFLRTPSGVQATEETIRIKGKLTSGFATIHDVLTEMKAASSATRVAVTLPESFAENWFTRRISDFYRQNSEVDLRLNASNRRVDLASEGFDFAVRYSPPPDDTFEFIELFGDRVLPVCTPGFAGQYGLNEKTQSMHGVPLVYLENRTPDPDWANWVDWCQAFGIDGMKANTGLRFSKISSGVQAAINGHGLVLCGIVESHDAIRRGQLCAPFGASRSLQTGYLYRLLWPRGRALNSIQQRFRNWVADLAAGFEDDVAAFTGQADEAAT